MKQLKIYLLGLMLVVGGGTECSLYVPRAAVGYSTSGGASGSGGSGGSVGYGSGESSYRNLNYSFKPEKFPGIPTELLDKNVQTIRSELAEASLGNLLKAQYYKDQIYVKLKEYKRPDGSTPSKYTGWPAYEFDGLVTDKDLITKLKSKKAHFRSSWVCVDPVGENARYVKNKTNWKWRNWNENYWAAVTSVEDEKQLYAKLQTKIEENDLRLGYETARWMILKRDQSVSGSPVPDDGNILCINGDESLKKAIAEWAKAQYALITASEAWVEEPWENRNDAKLVTFIIAAWKAEAELIKSVESAELEKTLYFLKRCPYSYLGYRNA